MIPCFVGGIGSGKTISFVRHAVKNNFYPYTNFKLKHIKYHRLRFQDIFILEQEKKDIILKDINWEFFDSIKKQHKHFCICFDELHNLIHARRSGSKMNVLMSKFISQARKILSTSDNDLVLITQTPRRIDINFRDLVDTWILCRKYTVKDRVWIRQKFYSDPGLSIKKAPGQLFLANPFFKYYDTNEMVYFKDQGVYI